METCKYCGNEIKIKGKLSMIGHITNCVEFKKWKDITFTYEYLYEEYVNKEKSALQIANENGWKSSTIINKQLRKLNISVRSIKQSHYTEKYKERIENTNIVRYGAINPLSRGTIPFEKKNTTVLKKYGVDNVWKNEIVKEKIRKSGAFKKLFPNYNIKSIPIIEQYGKENGYNFQHAENGGEYYVEGLGY